MDFDFSGSLILILRPCIGFLSVGPDVCRRLPSDSVSRRTPLPLAVTFPLSGRFGDFHPLEYVRAGRTKKEADLKCQPLYHMCSKYYSENLALRNSLLRRAMCSTEIPLGHSISQARVLVQLPKPSSSILATIALALLAASGRP